MNQLLSYGIFFFYRFRYRMFLDIEVYLQFFLFKIFQRDKYRCLKLTVTPLSNIEEVFPPSRIILNQMLFVSNGQLMACFEVTIYCITVGVTENLSCVKLGSLICSRWKRVVNVVFTICITTSWVLTNPAQLPLVVCSLYLLLLTPSSSLFFCLSLLLLLAS